MMISKVCKRKWAWNGLRNKPQHLGSGDDEKSRGLKSMAYVTKFSVVLCQFSTLSRPFDRTAVDKICGAVDTGNR
jgi:hypothetical protein